MGASEVAAQTGPPALDQRQTDAIVECRRRIIADLEQRAAQTPPAVPALDTWASEFVEVIHRRCGSAAPLGVIHPGVPGHGRLATLSVSGRPATATLTAGVDNRDLLLDHPTASLLPRTIDLWCPTCRATVTVATRRIATARGGKLRV